MDKTISQLGLSLRFIYAQYCSEQSSLSVWEELFALWEESILHTSYPVYYVYVLAINVAHWI